MEQSALPNFLILGSQKCGTTSLYQYLLQHPDVFFSTPKEPVFFEAQYERGLDLYRQRYFQGWSGQRAVGEARTHNLFLPFVPARIRRSLPDARLVAILRDPVDRAYSEWWHRYSRGIEKLPFERAIEENLRRREEGLRFDGPDGPELWARCLGSDRDARTSHGFYLELGYYAEQIERYLALFPRSQLKILLFDDLRRAPEKTTRDVFEFIGVAADVPLRDLGARNAALDRVRPPLSAKLRYVPRPPLLMRLLPRPLADRARGYLRGRAESRPPMQPATESWLLEHFAPHLRALEELLERPLPEWSRPQPARTGGGSAESRQAAR